MYIFLSTGTLHINIHELPVHLHLTVIITNNNKKICVCVYTHTHTHTHTRISIRKYCLKHVVDGNKNTYKCTSYYSWTFGMEWISFNLLMFSINHISVDGVSILPSNWINWSRFSPQNHISKCVIWNEQVCFSEMNSIHSINTNMLHLMTPCPSNRLFYHQMSISH